MNSNNPFAQYEKINKHHVTTLDIYTAQPGNIIICLMNTKSRLIGIVDRLCIVSNTFCVLRPVSISTNALYVLLKIPFVQQQLINNKNSIKDVKEVMLPYELSPPHNAVLSSISQQFQRALLDRAPFQDIIDNTFNELKYTLPLDLEDLVEIHKINEQQDENNLDKKDLPLEGVIFKDREANDGNATILLTRVFNDINDFRIGIICDDANQLKVNQNLIKLQVTTEIFEEIGFEMNNFSELILAKYLAYYFLSSHGKEQLALCFEKKDGKSFNTFKISKVKALQIPIPLNPRFVVHEMERQIYWHDAERYSTQLDFSKTMFEMFEKIINSLSINESSSHYVSKNLFTTREFGFLLAQYVVNKPLFRDFNVSVVLESMVHYGLFERHHQKVWDDIPIEFYSPHHEVEGDIIIVIQQFKQPLHLPENAKIIYLKGR